MKILFIGGTGNISMACTRKALEQGMEVFHLNRGRSGLEAPSQVVTFTCDINEKDEVSRLIGKHTFDVVADFIAYKPGDVERDYELFAGRAGQYVFISSASAYQKPPVNPVITESTPLKNPFWDYSREKIACEELLNRLYREEGFPVTIVRPSLTYETVIPVAIGGWDDYTIIDRMKKGRPVIVHGDGTSLWTITHSRDFALGFTGLLGNQQAIGESFHITSDELLTWDQIYQAVGAAAGVKPELVHINSEFICRMADSLGQGWMWGNLLGDKAVSVIFDNSKIKRVVPGFRATTPFIRGIRETVRWFEADPKRMKIVEENNHFMDAVIEKYRKSLKMI